MKSFYSKLPGAPSPSGKKNEKGVTLLELLIALVITGLVVSAGYSVYLNQHQGWIIQEQITNMQQNARVAI